MSDTKLDRQGYADMRQYSTHDRGKVEQKVLSVIRNKQIDTLVFRFESLLRYAKDIKFTKRPMLRLITRIPLGLICPIVLSLKSSS